MLFLTAYEIVLINDLDFIKFKGYKDIVRCQLLYKLRKASCQGMFQTKQRSQ